MWLEKGTLQDEDAVSELVGWRGKFLITNPFLNTYLAIESRIWFFFQDMNYVLLLNSNQMIQMWFNFKLIHLKACFFFTALGLNEMLLFAALSSRTLFTMLHILWCQGTLHYLFWYCQPDKIIKKKNLCCNFFTHFDEKLSGNSLNRDVLLWKYKGIK